MHVLVIIVNTAPYENVYSMVSLIILHLQSLKRAIYESSYGVHSNVLAIIQQSR